MRMLPVTQHHLINNYKNGTFHTIQAEVATEYPLTIHMHDEEFATIVCTPSNLTELTVGFLASEGMIHSYEEIKSLSIDSAKGIAYVDLHHKSTIDPAIFSKRRIGSCCGKSRQSFYFQSDAMTTKPLHSDLQISPVQCIQSMETLANLSSIHRVTGGVHNAILFSDKNMIAQYSDIGRHNALDKIFGACLQQNIETSHTILAISGRISSEMVLKAVRIGSPILLSKSAPTDLALQLADELGLTTVGFIRNGSFNVYTHPQRIKDTLPFPTNP
ncbi:MAG: formate dehydrogenase accessory sulfurtransferase FdhD [Paenibacillaceae bacterium]